MRIKFKSSIGKLRILLCFVIFLMGSASALRGDNGERYATQYVTLSERNASLSRIIWEMKQQTKLIFTYNTEDIAGVIVGKLNVTNESVYKVLDKCLERTELEYRIVDGVVVIRKKTPEPAKLQQQISTLVVRGHIADENNDPLIGATIRIEGTDKGIATDVNGNYILSGIKPGQVIQVSYIGKETVKRRITTETTVVNIRLKDKESSLDDVVITGYQTTSKERVTGAYAILSAKDIENKTETNLMSRIEGLTPGISNSGESRYNDVIIRGRSTINADTKVLYVVDGVPYEGDGDAIDPLKLINPNDVAQITVLKDAAAASIYGARAANGVVVITTHKGQAGKTKIRYNGSVRFSEAPSAKHLNLMGSDELVEYFQTVYNTVTPRNYSFKNYYNTSWKETTFRDPVYDALVAHDNGAISQGELNEKLGYYSALSNRNQIYDAFSRTAVTQQHNLSASGGSEKYKFYLSGSYMGKNEHCKYSSSKQYSISSRNDFTVSSGLTAYIHLTANANSSNQSNYNTDSYKSMLASYPSYYMLYDEEGNLLSFPNGRNNTKKSEKEINRLIGLGLKDEHYYPTQDMHSNLMYNRTNYVRIQGGFNWKIINGLSASAVYQTEIVNSKSKEHYLEESYYMRSNINDAAQVNGGTITYNVQLGGRLNESRSDQRSYTMRGQLDYNKTLGTDHNITALVGTERREVRNTSSQKVLLGYDENGMQGKIPNSALSYITGTEAISGYYMGDSSLFSAGISDSDDRFVSFYGNAAYNYSRRYDISGSIRFDESGLFGRKASNKWKPMWSTGVAWHISEERFMQEVNWINRLTVRLTYGIGGNLPRNFTSYPRVVAVSSDSYTNLYPLAYISAAKNEKLTWEKTATTNVGVDFSLLNSRLRGSFDYYQKRTTDLLGDKAADPTLGWTTIKINYGDMDNKGMEATLNGLIMQTRAFKWNAMLTYAYNKSKVRNFEVAQTVADYLYNNVLELGRPLVSVYSTRYAGLDDTYGEPLFYNKDNEKVAYTALTKEDLVYSGTRTPKYTSSLTNSFSYKDFELSFKLVYYGGHVIRDHSLKALSGQESSNFNRTSLNFWKAPGDELLSSAEPNLAIGPALNPTTKARWELGWLSRDTNVKKADYIKLRNINLSYRIPKAMLSKIKIEQLTLTFQADNLAWWASNGKIDPESSYSSNQYYYLSMRSKPTFSYGINVNF